MAENNNNSKKSLYLAAIFLLLLVNGVGAYFLIQGFQENEDLSTEIIDLKGEYASLQADFNQQLSEISQLKGQNSELDALLEEREAEIKAHLADIEKWKKQSNYNASELKKARASILAFEEEKLAFQEELEVLYAENKELKRIKQELEENLEGERATTQKLSEDKEFLSGKVELGSLLDADELYIAGIKVKGNGAEKEVNKVKNTEKILVCYQTGDNKVRDAGEVVMQLRLVSPDNNVMFIESEGSGTFVSKETGETIKYTQEASFNYENKNKKVCIYWSHNVDQSGEYTAEIYQDGYLLGSNFVELK